jgi:hypothetical protein
LKSLQVPPDHVFIPCEQAAALLIAQLDKDVDVVQQSASKQTPTPLGEGNLEFHGERQHGNGDMILSNEEVGWSMHLKKSGDLRYGLPSLP